MAIWEKEQRNMCSPRFGAEESTRTYGGHLDDGKQPFLDIAQTITMKK